MKHIHFIAALLIASALVAGCTKDNSGQRNIKLSQTYVSIPVTGGNVSITIDATESWEFLKDINISDKKDTAVYDYLPKWLTTQSTLKGDAGKYEVTLHADALDGGREQELHIKCGLNTQYLIVRQGNLNPVEATCAELITGGVIDKKYKLTGVVKKIVESAKYGRWYIEDATGSLYINGTNNSKGKAEKGALNDYGIEIGDVLTISGPFAKDEDTPQLKNVDVSKIVKSLIKMCSSFEFSVGAERDTVEVKLIYTGNNLDVATDSEWLSVLSTSTIKGKSDTTVVNILSAANESVQRNGNVTFKSAKNGQESIATVSVNQAANM